LAANPPLETRRRLEKVLETRNKAMIRGLRAVEVLEQIGTPEATQVLETLAKGSPNPRIEGAAAQALLRLKGP
jgi:HEAT repeat protein